MIFQHSIHARQPENHRLYREVEHSREAYEKIGHRRSEEHAAMRDNIKINIIEGLKCICSTTPACQTRYRTLTLSLYLFVSGSSPMKNDKRNVHSGNVTNSSLSAWVHRV